MNQPMDDVYRKLAQHLDRQPGGYPPTESGIELRILQRLFTPGQAALALHLDLLAEPAEVVARRAGLEVEETRKMLAEMADKGLIMDLYPQGKPVEYMIYQFVVGIWEFQVNRLDLELIRDVDAYIEHGLFQPEVWGAMPQLRTIPVGESLSNPAEVLPYEHAEKILDLHDRYAVADCICRKEKHMAGEGCDKPLEACLTMGDGADHVVRHGNGRYINKAEALEILRLANETGLVLQPSNSRNVGNICCCCGDCCGVLRTVKRYPKPAELIASAYRALVDEAACIGCGICIDRCQMDAITVEGAAVINDDRCIGCGLCASTCPTNAIRMQRKPQGEQPYVPRNITERLLRMGRLRGVITVPGLVKMFVRSRFDRLRTRKKEL